MRKILSIFGISALFLTGCASPNMYNGYVHAECDATTINKVTNCRVTEKPLPTTIVTVTPTQSVTPTLTPTPTVAPQSGPANLRLDPTVTKTQTSFRVLWDSVTGVPTTNGYNIYKNDVKIGTSSDTGESFSGLTANTTYKIGVSAVVNGIESGVTSANFTTEAATTPSTGVPVAGNWTQVFGDEFNDTVVDLNKWRANWYGEGGVMNKVGTYARNVTENNGTLNLKLESTSAGALVHTDFTGGYKFPVGSFVQASVFFPTVSGVCANWPAFWVSSTSADGWPSSGEHDIAEVLGGELTVNYHSPSGAHNKGAIAGSWCGSWHTYGIHRKATTADVYWDGVKVKSYSTDDNGKPEIIIFNMGMSSKTFIGGVMKVDWVRAYAPTP